MKVRQILNISIQNFNSYPQRWLLAISALFTILFHFTAYTGHYGYDDMLYARLASEWLEGMYDAGNHYSYRWTILLATSLSYLVFGINDFASSLPSILLSIGILAFLIELTKRDHIAVQILTIALTLLNQWFLFYTDKLMPDMYVAFFSISALFYFSMHRHFSKNVISSGILFTLSLFLCFLSKGTSLLLAPLVLFFFVIDVSLGRKLKFWLISSITGIALFIIYILVLKFTTGSYLSRFEALSSNAYMSLCSYGEQPVEMLIKRITIDFVLMLVQNGFAIPVLFVLAYLIQRSSLDLFRFDTPFSFFFVASVVLLLSANFMSISLSSYSPMCIDTRHYLFLLPILSIPAARIIYHFILRRAAGLTILILFLLIILSSDVFSQTDYTIIYFLLFLLFCIKYVIPTTFRKPSHFVMAFIILLMISLSE